MNVTIESKMMMLVNWSPNKTRTNIWQTKVTIFSFKKCSKNISGHLNMVFKLFAIESETERLCVICVAFCQFQPNVDDRESVVSFA